AFRCSAAHRALPSFPTRRSSDLAKGADISFADLDSATLFAAGLREADLRFTVLSGADLRFASLHAARLDEHTLIDSKWRTIWERSEEHTSELQSLRHLVCRLLLE